MSSQEPFEDPFGDPFQDPDQDPDQNRDQDRGQDRGQDPGQGRRQAPDRKPGPGEAPSGTGAPPPGAAPTGEAPTGAEPRGAEPRGPEPSGRLIVHWERGGGGGSPLHGEWSGEGYRRLRRAVVLLAGVLFLAGSALTVRTVQSWGWAQRIALLEAEQGQVAELARTLEEVEAAYERLRGLFLPESRGTGALWLPPAGAPGGALAPGGGGGGLEEEDAPPPSTWPLVERGVLTQPLVAPSEGVTQGHPGIDLAVPSGSYFRAIGPGVISERGEDEVYGLFVVVEHPGGYRSLYAHASVVVVERGRQVRDGEVLGLTGSSGRSTAPHLHLEITHQGEHVDPLTLLLRP